MCVCVCVCVCVCDLALCFQGSCMLLHVSVLCSFLLLNSILLSGHTMGLCVGGRLNRPEEYYWDDKTVVKLDYGVDFTTQ